MTDCDALPSFAQSAASIGLSGSRIIPQSGAVGPGRNWGAAKGDAKGDAKVDAKGDDYGDGNGVVKGNVDGLEREKKKKKKLFRTPVPLSTIVSVSAAEAVGTTLLSPGPTYSLEAM